MSRFLILFLPFLLCGCVSANLPSDVEEEVPDGATSVRVYSSESADRTFDVVYDRLRTRGYQVQKQDEERGSMTTGFREVGQETTLQISVYVQDSGGGSVATLRGRWGVTASMAAGVSAATGGTVSGGSAERAVWGERGRPSMAFGEMVKFARDLPHNRIEYEAQE